MRFNQTTRQGIVGPDVPPCPPPPCYSAACLSPTLFEGGKGTNPHCVCKCCMAAYPNESSLCVKQGVGVGWGA